MLHLFRTWRRSLLDMGAFRKYLLYAFGEVLLVMVGILLALQVSNWNDRISELRYEKKALQEIYSSLETDLEVLEKFSGITQALSDSNDQLLQLLDNEKYEKDRIGNLVANTARVLDIVFQTSAFESLRSRGVDKVSDDSIRVQLLNLYDIHYPTLIQGYENYNIHLRNEWRPYMIDHFSYVVSSNPNSVELGFYRFPLQWENLRSDAKARNIIILNRYITLDATNSTKNLMLQVKDLIEQLKSFLS